MTDIIIIGAGPAGLTAAIYARRAAKSVLVLEAMSFGGQIINTPHIENYPVAAHISGFDFATKVYEQAKALGAEFKFEKALEIRDNGGSKTVVTAKGRYEAKAVIIATGSRSRKLGVEGEDKLIGRGISYCAACDGAFFRNKTVAVAGGGNTALEDALYLADIAEKVYLIHRRDELRATKILQEELFGLDNVEVIWDSVVKEIDGEDKVTHLQIENVKTKEMQKLDVDGIFVAIGIHPSTDLFADIVELDEKGYVIAGEDCATSKAGIFVAGDSRQKRLRQIVTAVADGANAVTAVQDFLVGKEK